MGSHKTELLVQGYAIYLLIIKKKKIKKVIVDILLWKL